jgi:acetyl esterase/lipase
MTNKPDFIEKSFIYKETREKPLEIFMFRPPEAKKGLPSIVFFFGGGWESGSPEQFFAQCRYLASKGICAFSARYRTKSSHGVTPQYCVEDAKSVMRWLKQNASMLSIDADMIAAGGGSAGAHLAAATAFIKSFDGDRENTSIDCRPKALVLFNPVLDNSENGYGFERVREFWEDFSPLHNISDNPPPALIMVGDSDQLIPVESARNFKAAFDEKGGECVLKIYKGANHGFFNKGRFDDKFYHATLAEMENFLKKHGFISGQ